MILQGQQDLKATREKLLLLQEHYDSRLKDIYPGEMSHTRELSMQSLKSMINQLTEEIARFEAHKCGIK